MDRPSTSSTPGAQRQKRILPSRSRRGGPGVGNCDADVMILDTQRRKFENEPLIPAETPFLLTTNPAVASTSSSAFEINIHANDRYFERPDVLKAYREQLIIQTPEFTSLGDTPAGRLRARSQSGQINENGPLETSDDIYEKRHRKYETFEKRQRLREKEKLKHEQYKLKERIDQLRTMDASAFLSLDDDLFPAPLGHTEAEPDHNEETVFFHHGNGGPNNAEGERRRKEMLGVAHWLEERYRILLPSDRMKKITGGLLSTETSVEPEAPVYAGRYRRFPESEQQEPIIETVHQDTERLKLKIKVPIQPPTPTTFTTKSASSRRRQSVPPARQAPVRKGKTVQEEPHIRTASPTSFDVPPSTSPHVVPPISSSVPSHYEDVPPSPPASPPRGHHLAVDPHATDDQHAEYDQPPVSRPTTPMSNPDIAVLEPGSPETEDVHEEEQISASTNHPESISAPRPHKRVKRSPLPPSTSSRRGSRGSSLPPITSISTPHRAPSHASTVQSTKLSHGRGAGKKTPCLLMMQAIRSSEVGGRKGKRQTLPFGGKVPPELDSRVVDFELPEWMDPPRGAGGPDYPEYYAEKNSAPRTVLSVAT